MKTSRFHFVALMGLKGVSAHYYFDRISVNGGAMSNAWQYIRNVTTGLAYDSECEGCVMQMTPYYDIYDDNFRCGRGAATAGKGVETLAVDAGDELAFWASYRGHINGIAHSGAGQAYLSKVEGDLETNTGDGDWFKMGYIGAKNDTKWELIWTATMNFTIPKTTPPGKYLMRVEHSLPHMEWNETQWYVNCAHIEIKGPGGGKPGPMVKFPGAYDMWDSNYWAPYWVYGGVNLTKYTPPGPPLWIG